MSLFTGERLAPGTSVFTPNAASDNILTLQEIPGQTGDALDVLNSSGTNLFKVDASGNLTAAGTINGSGGTITGSVQATVDATGDTTTLTAAQSGSLVLMGKTSGSVVTLPTPVVGLKYDFVITVSNTTNFNKIITNAGSVFLLGSVEHSATGIAPLNFWADGSSIVSIKMDGAHLGGLVGSKFSVVCISATKWQIAGTNLGTATMTTAFLNA